MKKLAGRFPHRILAVRSLLAPPSSILTYMAVRLSSGQRASRNLPVAKTVFTGRVVQEAYCCQLRSEEKRNVLSKDTLTPFSGIARRVEYPVDSDDAFPIQVEDSIGKAPYQASTIALMDDGMQLGSPADSFKTSFYSDCQKE